MSTRRPPRRGFEIIESTGLSWCQSSKASRRGFCKNCGSSLFFDHGLKEPIGIAAGAFDGDPPFRLVAHIYTDEAGRYYDIADGAEQYDSTAWSRGGWKKFRSA